MSNAQDLQRYLQLLQQSRQLFATTLERRGKGSYAATDQLLNTLKARMPAAAPASQRPASGTAR
jgi:hypothetical protein